LDVGDRKPPLQISGIHPAQSQCVAGWIFLGIGAVCALIGRVLLVAGAFSVSVWWGLGIFLPFGPLLFRLSYPEVAPTSRYFRLAVLPCVLAYFLLEPGGFPNLLRGDILESANAPAAPKDHYAIENVAKSDLSERSAANKREFKRLETWAEALRLKKRDLLHSDAQGNIAYNAELGQYEAALAKATADKHAILSSK
jgi:hypothetical protein